MTACLLCPSPAVADGLCVADGARLSVSRWVLKGASKDWIRRTVGGTIELMHASAKIDTSAKALAFLDRLDAARAERDAKTCGREGCGGQCLEKDE